MTTILSQRKAGPWKRDIEKTKGTESISVITGSSLKAGPGNSELCIKDFRCFY